MKRRNLIFVLITVILVFLFYSCGKTGLKELQQEVKGIAVKMGDEAKKVQDLEVKWRTFIEDTFKTTDLSTIDISKMEEKDGGRYYFYQNKMFLRRFDPNKAANECGIGATGAVEITDKLKREIKLQELKLEPMLLEILKSNQFLVEGTLNSWYSSACFFPSWDMASFVPVGLDLVTFPYYQAAALSENKGKAFYFSPIITLGVVGPMQPCISAAYNEDKMIGDASIHIGLLKFSNFFIKDSKNILIIVYKDTMILATSPKEKEVIKLKVLEEFNYMELLKDNPKISDDIKLNNEKQAEDIKKLSELVKQENVGKNGLSTTINGKKYDVIIEAVPLVDYFIIGLI